MAGSRSSAAVWTLILTVVGIIAVVFVPPVLPLWLAAAAFRRRQRGNSALPELAFLTRPGRMIVVVAGWLGLLLVCVTAFAASISPSTDEHAAPVLGVFVIFGLLLMVAADLVAQALLAISRGVARRLRRA